jgi:hypothetical protein
MKKITKYLSNSLYKEDGNYKLLVVNSKGEELWHPVIYVNSLSDILTVLKPKSEAKNEINRVIQAIASEFNLWRYEVCYGNNIFQVLYAVDDEMAAAEMQRRADKNEGFELFARVE